MEALSTFLGLSLAAGVNLYAAILTVGLGVHFAPAWFQGLPGELSLLGHPAVIGVAGAMYLAEFVADKVPFFTPIWDGVHTFVRPLGAALLAVAGTAHLPGWVQVLAMLLGGTLALSTHATKMGGRLLAHAVPEPTTHSAISVAEDFGVVGVVLLAVANPLVAVPLLLAVVIGLAFLIPWLWRALRRALGALRRALGLGADPPAAGPGA